ncbi:MAG: pitrilysin family protein [Prevotella sp.]|nr:insulinase family protein [Prevotella sp.]MDY4217316.1 pitrilysin family protein [Prevotella sp.]
MAYNTAQLKNGLRIIHLPSTSEVVYCGYEINVGAANESNREEGMAHFCEHMTFKGTERRSSLDILKALENVGGDLNAYTTKTTTVYHSAILKHHFSLAVDLLSDIVFHSIYPQTEIDKEAAVICDEIESYNDSPAELIYDDFENLIFKEHPLGHSILGKADDVQQFTSFDAQRFTQRFYRPENAVFFAYGDIDFSVLIDLLENATSNIPHPRVPHFQWTEDATAAFDGIAIYQPSHTLISKNTHQAHVMIGNRAYDVHNRRRISLYLLNNILGGAAMSSRLNLSLREKEGLVYTVESFMTAFSKTGIWGIYFGCDPKDVERCCRLVHQELNRLMQEKLTETELCVAKQQIKGQIGIANDNREAFALGFGHSYLHYGWEKNTQMLYDQIDAITSDDLICVAQDLFVQDRLTTLVYC